MAGIYPDSGVAASAATNTVSVDTNNCDSTLFHSTTRCTPRFDPAAANAVMSELLNTVAAADRSYNCNRLDNLSLAISDIVNEALTDTLTTDCLTDVAYAAISDKDTTNNFEVLGIASEDGCNQIRKIPDFRVEFERLLEQSLTDCLTFDFPELDEFCGTPEFLVLADDGTGNCPRIARYSEANAQTYRGAYQDAHPNEPQNVGGFAPDFFPDPNNYYLDNSDLNDDYLAGTIDDAKIDNSALTYVDFTLDCEADFTATTTALINNANDVQTAYDQRATMAWRWRVDGGDWNYDVTAGGTINTGEGFNGITTSHTESWNFSFPAGYIEFQTFYIGDAGANPVEIRANTNPRSGAPASLPFLTIKQSV